MKKTKTETPQFLITHRTLSIYERFYKEPTRTRILLKFAVRALRSLYENTTPPTEQELDNALIAALNKKA